MALFIRARYTSARGAKILPETSIHAMPAFRTCRDANAHAASTPAMPRRALIAIFFCASPFAPVDTLKSAAAIHIGVRAIRCACAACHAAAL